jgi:hypothetical protein
MRLVSLSLDPETDQAVDSHIHSLRKQRAALRVEKIEEHFIHPSVISHLQHGGTQIAQMRNLCVLFIAKTSSGNSANWLMEVHAVLDRHRCPIVQIIDDDKGVHLTAAVNLYESVPEATKLAINACRELMSKQIGCAIGMAMGGTYCGVTGSAEIACRWDITGAPVVRAARLMQYAVNEDIPIAIDQSVYDNAAFSTMMEQFSCIYVKGCQKPITVYQMSPSKSVAASMIFREFLRLLQFTKGKYQFLSHFCLPMSLEVLQLSLDLAWWARRWFVNVQLDWLNLFQFCMSVMLQRDYFNWAEPLQTAS